MQPGYRNQFIRQQRAKGHLQLHYVRILQLCHDYCYHNITTFKRQMLSHRLTLLQNLHDWLALLPKWVLAYIISKKNTGKAIDSKQLLYNLRCQEIQQTELSVYSQRDK